MRKKLKGMSILFVMIMLIQGLSLQGIMWAENNGPQPQSDEQSFNSETSGTSSENKEINLPTSVDVGVSLPSNESYEEIIKKAELTKLQAEETAKKLLQEQLNKLQELIDKKRELQKNNADKQSIENEAAIAMATMLGDGSLENPYQVWTAEDLYNVRYDLTAMYIQMADIDLSAYENWLPIGTIGEEDGAEFSGGYDGNGFKITNLSINRPDENFVGLFGYMKPNNNELIMKNITLEDVFVLGGDYTGSLVGIVAKGYDISNDTVIIDNSHVTGYVSGKNNTGGFVGMFAQNGSSEIIIRNSDASVSVIGQQYTQGAGGFIGMIGGNASVMDCHSFGDVTGYDYVGGLVGMIWGNSINNNYATGNIKGNTLVGGLIGGGVAYVRECYSTGDVEGNENVGGLIGRLYESGGFASGKVEKSSATGTVSAQSYAGGLIGQSNAKIENSYSTGNVTGDRNIGGFIATPYNDIKNCYSTGNVTGSYSTGGFISIGYNRIEKCYAQGTVTGNGAYTGGFVGQYYGGMFNDCHAEGDVTGTSYDTGGFVGMTASTTIIKCYSTGNVIGDQSVGGFVGGNYSNIYDSYALGNVTGNTEVGGFVGESPCEIRNCYSIGAVSGNQDTGGFIGKIYDMMPCIVFNCYYNYETSGQYSENPFYAIPKTTLQMKNIRTYEGWDFNKTWSISGTVNNGYPSFRKNTALRFEYNDNGQLMQVLQGDALLIKYDYDDNGNLINEESLMP